MSTQFAGQLGRYRIEGALGRGAMGCVYRAFDATLQRSVAIKVLSEFNEQARGKLLAEARAASVLDHPNICTVHEVDEVDGQPYIVMALVDGKPLSALIPSDGLPTESVIRYGLQIADALAHAHERGVIHRDLKSANVVITPEGLAKVLDFGLATRLEQQDAEAITVSMDARAGAARIAGTLAYMAPEVLRGEEATARSDIWALGVLLYEMASGRLPFEGQTIADVSAAILKESPGSLGAHTPLALRAVTQRALAKEPGRRYAASGEVRAALEALSSADAGDAAARAARSTLPSIAVLPFTDMSPQRDQEYFCEGMAEEIINALTAVEGLRVASRTSAFQARARGLDIADIRARLHVGTVLEGSVRKAGTSLRVTAQLVDTGDDSHLWSERYDRDLNDVFAVQDEIAHSVVGELKVKLLGEPEAPMVVRPTEDVDAYNLYLKGRFHLSKRTPDGFRAAMAYFEQALEKDSHFALAYAGLADCHGIYAWYGGLPVRDAYAKTKALAKHALEIEPHSSAVHSLLGATAALYEYDWGAAEREFAHAMRLDPKLGVGHAWHGAFLLAPAGRDEEAAEALQLAVEQEPLSPLALTFAGIHRLLRREYATAVTMFRAALELEPNFPMARGYLGETYCHQHQYALAMTELRQAKPTPPGCHFGIGMLGYCYGRSGRPLDAERLLGELHSLSATTYIPALSFAMIHMGMDSAEPALDWLDRAYEERCGALVWMGLEPLYDSLRGDPRFQSLLQRMNFPAV